MHAQQKCLTLGIKYDLLNEQTKTLGGKLYSVLIILWQVLMIYDYESCTWVLHVIITTIAFTFIGLRSAMIGLQHTEMGENNV